MSGLRRVALIDSGLGGLGVLSAVRALVPGADIFYFADTAHVPYGDRDLREVAALGRSMCAFLERLAPLAIAVASGTTCAAFDAQGRPRVRPPLIGFVEHGALAAAQTAARQLGIVATQATIDSGIFERKLKALRPKLALTPVAAPKLVPLVEAARWDSDAARLVVLEACAPLVETGCDTVLLGCTHFPHLIHWFREALGEDVGILDPARACAEQVAMLCSAAACDSAAGSQEQPEVGRTVLFVSGDERDFGARAIALAGIRIDELQHVAITADETAGKTRASI